MKRTNTRILVLLGLYLLWFRAGYAAPEEPGTEELGFWDQSRAQLGAFWDESQSLMGGAWDKTRSLWEGDPQADAFSRVWSEMLPTLDQGLSLAEELDELPERSWFGPDRVSKQGEIDELLDQAVAILSISPLQGYRERIRALEEKIAEAQEEIAAYRTRRVAAPKDSLWKTTVEEYDAEIASRQEQIQAYRQELEAIRGQFASDLREIGLDLSDQQLEFLLSTVVGDNLVDMGVAFDNVKSITGELQALMEQSGEELPSARRYYGMYVVLLQVLDRMHGRLLEDIEQAYLPQIDAITGKTEQLTAVARRLQRQPGASREILDSNLQALELTRRAAGLYREYLVQQSREVSQSRQRLQRDISTAWNTYETVKVSGDLVSLIRTSGRMLGELFNRQVPELRPFANLEMQREFQKLTVRLRSAEAP
jgi:hypothetical protein